MVVWFDGHLVADDQVSLSAFDRGLLTGFGVFETLRAYEGMPFAWTRHMRRLARSAGILGMPLPDAEELRRAARAVVQANGLADARLRVTLTGGTAADTGSGRTLVTAVPIEPVAASADVVIVPWPRNERGALTGVKSTSYAENACALAYATARGAGEAVFANLRDELCEGAGSNVFLVEDGRVVTPPEATGCLPGVTRALVLEVCEDEGIDAVERRSPVDALARASEAFLTSTTREVQAIARVDDRMLETCPGPFTVRITLAFRALRERDPDP